jgi:PhnB protein
MKGKESMKKSTATVQPYIHFNGRCEEAIKYYQDALGAEVLMQMRFKEAPEAPPPGRLPPGFENKIMHAHIRFGAADVLMTDGPDGDPGKTDFRGISLCLTAEAEAEAKQFFDKLAKDGKAQMPFGKTFFSPGFGMVTDRFGIRWMVFTKPAE